MATWMLTSRLSPFSNSLLSSSPPSLPPLPTLAELQKHAEDAKQSIQASLPSLALPQYGDLTTTKEPPKAVSISHSVRQPVRPWGSPPPVYSIRDPGSSIQDGEEQMGGEDRGRKLKKGKMGWRRIQGNIPDEEKVPRMDLNRRYARRQEGQQVDVGMYEVDKEKTWWEWLTCRS